MGFLKAFASAASGSFADQWKDFYGPKQNVSPTAAVFQAVPYGQNAGRGENYKGSQNIITNGSKIVVPEGTALITLQDGQITGLIAEPGGYEYKSDDINSQSLFAGSFLSATIVQSFERFKFGGMPGSEQLAFYINLKEIAGNKFGTKSEIYWDDAYLNAQVGAITRGTYTLRIIDPVLFIKNVVPLHYLQAGAPEFDFSDMDNPVGQQLFDEVVGSLSAAFSNYVNDPTKGNRITKIQGDSVGFAESLSQAVEDGYQWRSNRGLEIVKSTLTAIEYDADSKQLLSDVKKADALSGARGNSFMQQSMARGMQAAGENGGGTGMAFMGMGMQAGANMMQGMQQPAQPAVNPFINIAPQQPVQQPMNNTMDQTQATMQQPQSTPTSNVASGTDPYEELKKAKDLLDAGIITAEDFEAKKKVLLGI